MTLAAIRTSPTRQQRPPQWPLLRRAPGRMLRGGVLAGMILMSVALLTALVTAGPLFASATAFGTLDHGLDAIAPTSAPATGPELEVTVNGPVPGSQARIRSLVRSVPYLGEPRTTLVANAWRVEQKFPVRPFISSGSAREQALLYHRTGVIPSLQIAAGKPGSPGLWLPEGLAETLGVGPGSSVVVGKRYLDREPSKDKPVDTATQLTVAGTYRTRPDGRTPLGPAFTGLHAAAPSDPAGSLQPAMLLIGDLPTISRALTDTREVPLLTHTAGLTQKGRNPARLSRTADAIRNLQRQAADPISSTAELLQIATQGSSVRSGIPAIQERTAA